MTMQRRIAAVAVMATGLLSVGVSTASAHTGVLHATGQCQDDGTRLITYTGSTQGVPESQPGHQATLTVGNIQPSGAQVTPSSQTVVGNTTFTFTQTISGDAGAAQATGFLAWADGATSDPGAMTAYVAFTTHCTPPVVVPPVVVPPVVVPPVVVAPAVVVSPAEAVVNPLPVAAAAGEADTSGQLAAGGLAGMAAFLMLGAGSVLRRRRGEA